MAEETECAFTGDERTTCSGEIHWRKGTPRCATHYFKLLDELEAISRRYPDSPCAPAWFDPAYAGERWDDDY